MVEGGKILGCSPVVRSRGTTGRSEISFFQSAGAQKIPQIPFSRCP